MVFKIIFLITISLPLQAGECLLTAALKNPALRESAEFWDEYNKLSGALGKIPEHKLKALIEKFGGIETTGGSTSLKITRQIIFESKAEKEISSLPIHLRGKVDEFLEIMSSQDGIKSLYQNPGKWHHEKLKKDSELHTVRLNDGYRVLFEIVDRNVIIQRVNKGQIHGN